MIKSLVIHSLSVICLATTLSISALAQDGQAPQVQPQEQPQAPTQAQPAAQTEPTENVKPTISNLVDPKHKKPDPNTIQQLAPNTKAAPQPEPQEGEKPNNTVYIVHFREYEELYHQCGLSECCRASINEIRKDLADPDYVSKTGEIKDCPDGMLRKALPCPNSMTWCIPKPKPIKRPYNREGRGKSGAVGRLNELEVKKAK